MCMQLYPRVQKHARTVDEGLMNTNILSAISDIRRMGQQRPDLEVCIFIGIITGPLVCCGRLTAIPL